MESAFAFFRNGEIQRSAGGVQHFGRLVLWPTFAFSVSFRFRRANERSEKQPACEKEPGETAGFWKCKLRKGAQAEADTSFRWSMRNPACLRCRRKIAFATIVQREFSTKGGKPKTYGQSDISSGKAGQMSRNPLPISDQYLRFLAASAFFFLRTLGFS